MGGEWKRTLRKIWFYLDKFEELVGRASEPRSTIFWKWVCSPVNLKVVMEMEEGKGTGKIRNRVWGCAGLDIGSETVLYGSGDREGRQQRANLGSSSQSWFLVNSCPFLTLYPWAGSDIDRVRAEFGAGGGVGRLLEFREFRPQTIAQYRWEPL